jgi:hypothetical protein
MHPPQRTGLYSLPDLRAARIVVSLPAQTPDARGGRTLPRLGVNLESDEIVEWLSGEIARTPSGDPTALTDSTGRISHAIVPNDCRPASVR